MGAWIETRVQLSLYEQRMSHPMWVRGLKQCGTVCRGQAAEVAPYVGAWIETLLIVAYVRRV